MAQSQTGTYPLALYYQVSFQIKLPSQLTSVSQSMEDTVFCTPCRLRPLKDADTAHFLFYVHPSSQPVPCDNSEFMLGFPLCCPHSTGFPIVNIEHV